MNDSLSKRTLNNGCWTCRLRRKKCDEARPVCDICAILHITCHYSVQKPDLMDSGPRQQQMANVLKREVKTNAHSRSANRAAQLSSRNQEGMSRVSMTTTAPSEQICSALAAASSTNGEQPLTPESYYTSWQGDVDAKLFGKIAPTSKAFGQSDSILLLFYLDHLLPFLFPFYRPSLLEGGRAWILQMMIHSPVVRQAALCQSSYFFSLLGGTTDHETIWTTMLAQTKDAYEVLRQAIQVIHSSNMLEHMHGAVRTMASIVRILRFEIAVSSFDNCGAHLNAAAALFRQLLESQNGSGAASYQAVMRSLGPAPWISPTSDVQTPSAEQAAFRFSSALLIFDDIIASTTRREAPMLSEYHDELLGGDDAIEPLVSLEDAIGCQSWVLLQIARISDLKAWKRQRRDSGDLDMMQVVARASAIKDALSPNIDRVRADWSSRAAGSEDTLLRFFAAANGEQAKSTSVQKSVTTLIWAHAASLYLFLVVSGWQTAHSDVHYHVAKILELLTNQAISSAVLRTLVWPLCLAGCLAETTEEERFCAIAGSVQSPQIYGTVRKALEIMEFVWQQRRDSDIANRDFSTCFQTESNFVLLV